MSINYVKDQNFIVTLTMDMPGRSANVINATFGEALQYNLARLEQEDPLAGVIITSAKKTFMAGGDIEWLYAVENAQEAFKAAEDLKQNWRKLETIGVPVIAAINGSALGGGLELALACHYRIVIDDPRIKLGFPEVTLGLLPGGGGITRTIRLIGLQDSFPFLIEGKQITPQEALKAGLIHELADDQEDLMTRAKAAFESGTAKIQPWDTPAFRIPGGSPSRPAVAQMLAIAPAMLRKKTYGNYPASDAILNAAVEGAMVDFDTASRIESRYFAQLAVGKVAKNMIKAFWFQLNELNAGKSRPELSPSAIINNIGVLGAGMMGHGIAYVSAYAGINVVLKDVSLSRAEAGKETIKQLIQKRINQGKLTNEDAQLILNRISPSDSAADLKDCELVIEAVFEDRELKAQVTTEAEENMESTAVFASNTSTLPITSLAKHSSRPFNFIGLHFFSPVHKMKLVEIIRGELTSDETLAKAFDYVRQIGKTPIVVRDSRGFYTSRVFATYVQEGMAMLGEGQVPRAIESAGLKAGMPVGPLALSDEVSLGLMNHINEQTRKDYAAQGIKMPDHPAHKVLNMMIKDFGRYGKAHGGGFYEYPPNGKKYLWPELQKHFPLENGKLTQEEMIDRLLFIQALETARCYEEGVLLSVADANIGSIFGWGFAPFKGGTLQFINDYGLADFVSKSQELADKFGKRFEPPQILLDMVQKNEQF